MLYNPARLSKNSIPFLTTPGDYNKHSGYNKHYNKYSGTSE